jgi:hypothetical protein
VVGLIAGVGFLACNVIGQPGEPDTAHWQVDG